jgi:hypothetical protein
MRVNVPLLLHVLDGGGHDEVTKRRLFAAGVRVRGDHKVVCVAVVALVVLLLADGGQAAAERGAQKRVRWVATPRLCEPADGAAIRVVRFRFRAKRL